MSIRGPVVKRIARLCGRLAADVRAATAVEYGLIVSMVVIAALVAIIQVAGTTSEMWNNVNNKVTAAR